MGRLGLLSLGTSDTVINEIQHALHSDSLEEQTKALRMILVLPSECLIIYTVDSMQILLILCSRGQ